MLLRRNALCTASAILLLGSTLFTANQLSAQSTTGANSTHSDFPHVMLSTNMGDMLVELDSSRAPATVGNFLAYVDDDFYDGTVFHRVIDGFMIQGGGFTPEFQRKATRPPVSNEAYNGLRNSRYTIAMARTNAPHSATSQFFINSANNDNLDHKDTSMRGWGYTVFGRVVEGQHVVDAISTTRTSSGGPFSRDVPIQTIIIESVERVKSVVSPTGESNDQPVKQTDNNSDDSPNAAAAKPTDNVIQNTAKPANQDSTLDIRGGLRSVLHNIFN